MSTIDLRTWLDAHPEIGVSGLARALGVDRSAVYRWLSECPPRGQVPLALVLPAVAAGARARALTSVDLREWLRRSGYDERLLAEDLGVHPTTVRRWLLGTRPLPLWLSLALRHVPGRARSRLRERARARERRGPTHGTRSRYNGGCRCARCRKANREYFARRVQQRALRPTG